MSAALTIANLVNTNGFNWRTAFYCGAVIALIGFFARTKLRETQDFINAKKRFSIVSDGNIPVFLERDTLISGFFEAFSIFASI